MLICCMSTTSYSLSWRTEQRRHLVTVVIIMIMMIIIKAAIHCHLPSTYQTLQKEVYIWYNPQLLYRVHYWKSLQDILNVLEEFCMKMYESLEFQVWGRWVNGSISKMLHNIIKSTMIPKIKMTENTECWWDCGTIRTLKYCLVGVWTAIIILGNTWVNIY